MSGYLNYTMASRVKENFSTGYLKQQAARKKRYQKNKEKVKAKRDEKKKKLWGLIF